MITTTTTKNKSLRSLALPIILALTLIATAVQSFLLIGYYNSDELLYDHSVPTALRVVIWILFAITLVASIVIALTVKSGRNVQPKQVSPIAWTGASILVVSLIAFCAFSLFVNLSGDRVPELIAELAEQSTSNDNERSMTFATYLAKYGAYLAILAAVSPAVMLTTSKASPIPAIFTSVWAMTVALRTYYDIATPMNDPMRLLRIVGSAGAILAFCLETRAGLRRLTDRLALTLGSVAFFATAVSSVPMIICYAANKMLQTDLFTAFALLGTALISLDRIVAVSRAKRRLVTAHDPEQAPIESVEAVEAVETNETNETVETTEINETNETIETNETNESPKEDGAVE